MRATDSATGTVHLAYDGLDRMRSMTSPQGAVSYRYDDAGRRTRMETGRGNVVNYQYTAAGRLVRISSGQDTVSFSYDPDGRMTSMALPNGVTTSVHYDARSRPDAMQYAKGGSSLGALTYSYDANGERVTVGESFARATLPDQVSSATYNKDNELTNWGPSHLTYNADGELTNDGTFSYGWNARGELASTSGSGQSESFSYDALDRRVQRTHGGTTTSYLYDGANPIRESSKSGGVSLLTGLGTDQFLARRGTGGTRYFLPDGLGSTVALADPAGSLSTQYTYDPHGDSTASSPSPNEVRFAGRERDPSGLYYDRARYYSPRFDRFISSDPIGFAGGSTNTYAYAGGDPVNVRDVSGLSFSDTIRDGASAVVGELGGLWSAVSGAIECAANSAWNWVKDQFSNETTRPYAIAISVLLAALVVVATWPLALTIVQVVGTELFGAGEPEWVELAAQRGAFPEGEVEFAPTSPFGTIPAEPPIGDTAVTGTGVVPAEPPIADPPAIGTGVIPTDPPIPTGGPGIRPAFVVNPIDVSSWARTLSLMGW